MVNFKLGFGKEISPLREKIKNYSPREHTERTEKRFFRVREKNTLPQIYTKKE